MNIKKIILILLILAISISMFGCKATEGFKKLFSKDGEEIEIIRSDEMEFDTGEEDGMRKTVLYFKNGEGFLVPVMRKVPWEEGIAKLALKNMIDSPTLRESLSQTGLSPIIPAGTEIKGMSINNETGICKVDFTKEVLNYENEKDEETLIKGVVYTLTEFPAVKEVQIMIDGEVLPAFKYGSEVNKPIKRQDINLVENLKDANSNVVVYYKGTDNGEFEYFVPVTVPTLAPMSNVFTALEELFDGPPEETGLFTDIPNGVNLQGVELKEGVAYVDLAVDSLDSLKEEYIFDSVYKNIGLTLGQFEEVSKVELLIDGKTLDEAGLEFMIEETIPAFANEY